MQTIGLIKLLYGVMLPGQRYGRLTLIALADVRPLTLNDTQLMRLLQLMCNEAKVVEQSAGK